MVLFLESPPILRVTLLLHPYMDSKVGNDRKEVFALDTLLESFLERLGMDRRRIFKAIILSWIVCIIFLFFSFSIFLFIFNVIVVVEKSI